MHRKSGIKFLAFVFPLIVYVRTQQSFAATKFDLDANLPPEEPEANLDPKPTEITKKPEEVTVPPTTPTTTTTTTLPPTTITTTISLPQTSTTLPVVLFVTPQQQNLPLSVVPQQQPSQPAQQIVPQRNIQQLPTLLPVPSLAANLPVSQNLTHFSRQPNVVVPQRHTVDSINSRASNTFSERAELWFREDYDIRHCPKDAKTVADAFRRKFPRNLLRNGKEAQLAQLLSSRIAECIRKNTENHWQKIDDYIESSIEKNALGESEECRQGLIEEQIACLNVFSYACQFIQPVYEFRLVPTRLIVQEARFAEDGADKCRKIVHKFKSKNSPKARSQQIK